MLDQVKFGEKLKNYRKSFELTQDELGARVGVSGQAVSKWESGECLPDCFNLKALGDIYGISLDILLDTGAGNNIKAVAERIKQLATEFVWSKMKDRTDEESHREMGDDLWEMWKAVYFVEIGDHGLQELEMSYGKKIINGEYGCKVWDDAGVACTVKSIIKDNLAEVTERELAVAARLVSPDYFPLIRVLDCYYVVNFEELCDRTGINGTMLSEMLRRLIEDQIVEFFVSNDFAVQGYKLTGTRGMTAYMILAVYSLLASKRFSIGEYLPH
jgi:Predicted transcriptional regulators